jgi:Mechanosensitive ion channel, conserved TM helix
MEQIADHVANFLPGVLVALSLIVVTFVAAALARLLLVRGLRRIDFDRRMGESGIGPIFGWTAGTSPSLALPRVVYWTIVVLGLLVSLTALNATIPSQLALSVFEYLPHVLAALAILVGGAIAARFLAHSVLIGAVNMQIHSARLLSLFVKWLVLLVTVTMALDHLGIGRSVLTLAFGILFGGVVFAAALAVGLGARDAVSRALERQDRETASRDDKVDHV